MLKRICIVALLMAAFLTDATAKQNGDEEKVVSNKISLLIGPGNYVDHYFSPHQYQGVLVGLKAEHGAFYKRSENLSWEFNTMFFSSPGHQMFSGIRLTNPSGSAYIAMNDIRFEYGTQYHWNLTDNFALRLGGSVDFMAGLSKSLPDGINNSADFDLQTQLKLAGGLKYGLTFNRFGLAIFADFAVPVVGGVYVCDKYEGPGKTPELTESSAKKFILSSFHNMKAYDAEVGIDFNFHALTFSVSAEKLCRKWHAYGIQNVRDFTFVKIGFGVDLVSVSRISSRNRYF